MKLISIVLAGGKGSRMNSKDKNKTVLEINGKPLLQYGIETLEKISEKIFIVVGAFAESVRAAIKSEIVEFAEQKEQLGTGHAVKVAVEDILSKNFNSELVLICYGDHIAQYDESTIQDLINFHKENHFSLSIISTTHEDPMSLAWGRIVRSVTGEFDAIVEQKDATEEQKVINEVNAGFYCIDWEDLKEAIFEITPSKVTGEFYLTDLVEILKAKDKTVGAFKVPFDKVGLGVNTPEQLELLKEKLTN